MPDKFADAMAFVLRPENDGQPIHFDPRDPGGATAWGVTFTTWCGWQRMHNLGATLDVFRVLRPADVLPLYRVLFWNAVRGDTLPAGVGLMVFDAAVGSGPLHAARWLQTAVGADVDGQIGPRTLAAVAQIDPADLVGYLASLREDFYATLPTFSIYGRGWDRRCEDCRRLALDMIAAAGKA